MATVNGSLELIRDDGGNLAFPVANCDPANVPTIAGAVFAVTGITAVTPTPAGVTGQWTATTADLHSATLNLHQETPFDQTLVGRWLAGGASGSVI